MAYFLPTYSIERGRMVPGISQDAGFWGLVALSCNLSGCLTLQWSLEIIVAEGIGQSRSAFLPWRFCPSSSNRY